MKSGYNFKNKLFCDQKFFIAHNLIVYLGIELEFYSQKDKSYLTNIIKKHKLDLIQYVKKEEGLDQYEICTQPTDDLNLLFLQLERFKDLTKIINDFSAKPFLKKPGSAMHVHISIHDSKSRANVFDTETKIKFFIIGGLCKNIKSSMRIFAPNADSYKRFQYHDKFTPRFANWGFEDNKTNAIRVTSQGTIEHRIPCADANAMHVMQEILYAISDGIENKIMPDPPNFGEPKYFDNFELRIPLSYQESCNY